LDRSQSALAHITPGVIERYVAELATRVSSVTVHGSTYKLRRVVEIIDPTLDVDWLKELELDLQDRARPKPRANRLISSGRIFEAGIKLIRKAEKETKRTPLQNARIARNGLLIAFLAVCPIRLKNLATLKIGETIVHQDDRWWLVLSAADTKAGRQDHRVLPDILTPWLDLYMERYKPVFPSSKTAMWPSQYGGAMSAAGIQRLVADTTAQVLGKSIRPHMFRHCVPYTIANMDGSKIGLASALLQHSNPRTTEKYYNLGHSVESSKIFASLVSKLELSSDQHTGKRAITSIGATAQNRKGA